MGFYFSSFAQDAFDDDIEMMRLGAGNRNSGYYLRSGYN